MRRLPRLMANRPWCPQLERALSAYRGGSAGNGHYSANNRDDFVLNSAPSPQNSGSPTTPAVEKGIEVALLVPDLVPPGEQFNYEVQVVNSTGSTTAVSVSLPIASHFELIEGPAGAVLENGRLNWTI